MPTTGTRLRYYRQRAKLSQDTVAERIGAAQSTISKWENDEGSPDLKLAEDLARLYGTAAANFFPSTPPRDLGRHDTEIKPPAGRVTDADLVALQNHYDQLRNDMQGFANALYDILTHHPEAASGVPAKFKKTG